MTHLISKTDFTAIKYSGQGNFKVKKGTIDTLLLLLKTIASVNDPLVVVVSSFGGSWSTRGNVHLIVRNPETYELWHVISNNVAF